MIGKTMINHDIKLGYLIVEQKTYWSFGTAWHRLVLMFGCFMCGIVSRIGLHLPAARNKQRQGINHRLIFFAVWNLKWRFPEVNTSECSRCCVALIPFIEGCVLLFQAVLLHPSAIKLHLPLAATPTLLTFNIAPFMTASLLITAQDDILTN